MDITPTPEFLEACRRVLGGDDPATVLGAIRRDDRRMNEVYAIHADLVRSKQEGTPCAATTQKSKGPHRQG